MTAARWLAATAALAACSDPTAPTGARVVRTEQALGGMPIYQRAERTLLAGDGRVVMTTARPLDLDVPRTSPVFAADVRDEAGAIRRAMSGARVGRARARKVWYPYANQLVAAWVVEAYTDDDLVRTIIAADGRELSRESLVADAAFSYRVFADPTTKQPYDGPIADATPHPTGAPDGSFPTYVAPSFVLVDSLNSNGDPWLPAGATETNGNNVDAYADFNDPNGLTSGDFRAAAAIGSTFPYVYDTSQPALASREQQQAAITSLFYSINWLHDFWYDAGFDELAGNAQASNYGRGGGEGDVLLAEAQDSALAGARNNANMATPDDGMSPRMQVYLWTGKDTRSFTLSPSGRTLEFGTAVFGPREIDVTGAVILGVDGQGANGNDGCEALTNGVSGAIVLVDRGNCTYKTKTRNAQSAGALAIIIADNQVAQWPPGMGNDSMLADPTIPSVSITREAGIALKADLADATTATITRALGPELDGSLDSTLVAHEFGHYLHHRLSVCNATAMCRALSEGWGDFTALMLLARPGDDLRGAFPFSIYTTQGNQRDPAYFGIRRAPYSVDTSVNALSFRHMANGEPLPTEHPIIDENPNSEVHNAGEVWAAALWEVYVALHEDGARRGLSFDEVRAKMARYVVTGLQLVPENASPLESRDALLAAAQASDPADFPIMAAAFARRGFGSCAVAPPPLSIGFTGIVESSQIAGNATLAGVRVDDGCDEDSVLDAGETARFTIRVTNQGHLPLRDVELGVVSATPGVSVLSAPLEVTSIDALATLELAVAVSLDASVADAMPADLSLQVTASDGCVDTIALPLAARFNVDDVLDASATDTFDALASFWEPWAIAWSHVRDTPLDGHWHGDDLALASDTRLTSPRLVASADAPLTIRFAHRHAFEQSDNTNWDGGIIEYSLDEGVTWDDIATLAAPGYTGTLTDSSGNPLGGRSAFVGANAAWPAYEMVTLDLGSALANKPFRIRFRIATDAGTGAHGWDIDDVAFDGIVGTPFPAQRVDDAICGTDETPVDDPITSGGGGCCNSRGSANNLFVLVSLLFLRRRRYLRVHGK